jgi:chitin disaccharide deacetylase
MTLSTVPRKLDDLMTRSSSILFLTILILSAATAQPLPPARALIRCDDIGMCHSVNMALKEVLDTGIPFSASVMFTCPWYQEAVEIMRGKPQVTVGIHLTLNSEWKTYRWGPVAGAHAVPSLVDSVGYFFPSRASTMAHHPTLVDAEREFRAQIHRALASGLRIEYLDTHMSTIDETPEFMALAERLAAEYGLAISRYFGEKEIPGLYSAPVAHKTDSLLAMVNRIDPSVPSLLVFHIGRDTPEMQAMLDLNPSGPPDMSRHREGELRALLSPEFRAAVARREITLMNYRDLISTVGREAMKRP